MAESIRKVLSWVVLILMYNVGVLYETHSEAIPQVRVVILNALLMAGSLLAYSIRKGGKQ